MEADGKEYFKNDVISTGGPKDRSGENSSISKRHRRRWPSQVGTWEHRDKARPLPLNPRSASKQKDRTPGEP